MIVKHNMNYVVVIVRVTCLMFLLELFSFVCSVLVHSGGVHGGHYYAFIRPTLSDQWYVSF